MKRLSIMAMLLATAIAPACNGQVPSTEPTVKKEIPMMFETSEDRLPRSDVPPVERDGVSYSQAEDGRDLGIDQVGGVLVASETNSGKRLWTLAVYKNPIDPKLEQDVQWVYFTSMVFDPDGRLRITNEAGKTFLVDVKTRKSTPTQ